MLWQATVDNVGPSLVLLVFVVVLPMLASVLSRTRFHAVVGSAVLVLGAALIGYAIYCQVMMGGSHDESDPAGDLVVWFALIAATMAFAYGGIVLYLSRRARVRSTRRPAAGTVVGHDRPARA